MVTLDVLRDGKHLKRRVRLGERPAESEQTPAPREETENGLEWLGLSYQDLTPGLKGAHGIPGTASRASG